MCVACRLLSTAHTRQLPIPDAKARVAQFSDGVGYDWVDGLKEYAERMVSDASWDARAQTFPEDTPRNREYYLLRSIFAEHFSHPSAWKTVPKVTQP